MIYGENMIKFNNKNLVSCTNESIYKVLWEYICWILAGKPNNHSVKGKK
jgi:hypothetical protein